MRKRLATNLNPITHTVNFRLPHLGTHNTLILLLYNVIGGGGIFTSLAAPATSLNHANYNY